MRQTLQITLSLSDSEMAWDLTINNEHHTELTTEEVQRHVMLSLDLAIDALIPMEQR